MLDCPCGYGEGMAENQEKCPECQMDLEPLHRLRALPLEQYREALDLLEQEENFAALVRLKTVLTVEPGHLGARMLLADLLNRMGRYEEAMDQVQRIMEMDPDYPGARELEHGAREGITGRKVREEPAATRSLTGAGRWAVVGLMLLAALVAFWPGPAGEPEPEAQEELSVAQAAALVEEEILGREELQELDVRVEAREDAVLLAGEVPSETHRTLLLEVARREAEPFGVEDGLAVAAPAEEEGEGPDHFLYRVKPGDNLYQLAWRFYSDGGRWGEIYEANREELEDPSRLEVGRVLKIPQPELDLTLTEGS